jgi:proline-serine-threonine phosphatase interacting protein 1
VDLEDYLERRAKIEKQYAEELLKLSRTVFGKDEIGSLRRSYDQLKLETETTGKLHMQLSLRIQEDVLKTTKEFRNQQKEVRKKTEDTVKRSQVHKKNCFDKNNRLRSTYEAKCKEYDKAQEQMHKLETNPLTKPKDMQNAHKKTETCKVNSNSADVQYQEAVKTLEDARVLWEREMDYLCNKFQELEEHRIAFLRHQMWTMTNFCSQTLVDDDESQENIRRSLENCNVDEDIDLFIKERATGVERPATIPYENFYNPRAVLPGVPSAFDVAHKELPPIPIDDDDNMIVESNYSVPTALPDSHYSTPRTMGIGGAGVEKVIALYDYESQGDEELTLAEGDILTVLGKEDTVWWCGQLNGKIGMFPATYVEPHI